MHRMFCRANRAEPNNAFAFLTTPIQAKQVMCVCVRVRVSVFVCVYAC